MVVLKKIFSQLAFVFILFVILELVSIKLFPEYSQNQKYVYVLGHLIVNSWNDGGHFWMVYEDISHIPNHYLNNEL